MTHTLLLAVSDKLLLATESYFESGEYIKPFRSKDIADCVLHHSAAAGVAAMAAGILPGAGAVISLAIAVGAIWSMYVRICKIIGVPFGKNKLKSISSAILTDIVTQLAGTFAIQTAASLIPVAGSVINGVGNFATTYCAGLVFLTILTKLFKAKRTDVGEMSDDEWKDSVKSSISSINMKAVYKEAKSIFTEMRNDGTLEQVGKEVDISMDHITEDEENENESDHIK